MRLFVPLWLLCSVALAAEPATATTAATGLATAPSVSAADHEAQRAQVADLRTRLEKMRADLTRDDARRNAECYHKALVNACLEDAREEKLRVEGEIRKLNLEANRLERKIKAEERTERQASLGNRESRAAEAARRKQEHEQMAAELEATRRDEGAQGLAGDHQQRLQSFAAAQSVEQARIQDSAQRGAQAGEQIGRTRAQITLLPAKINKVKEAERLLDRGPSSQTSPTPQTGKTP